MVSKIDDLDNAIEHCYVRPAVIEIESTGCPKCRIMNDMMHQAARDPKVEDLVDFMTINISGKEECVAKFGITNLPSFLFIMHDENHGGRVKSCKAGVMGIKAFLKTITEELEIPVAEGIEKVAPYDD